MPAEWWHRSGTSWKFWCQIDWEHVKEVNPMGFKKLVDKYQTDDWTRFPQKHITCGAKFFPWKNGASKVIEIETDQGWIAFVAERLPEALDDEIKGKLYEWHQACKCLTAEDIRAAIPEVWPRCHLVPEVPGIGRFPIAKWIQMGSPTLGYAGWIALCQKIASKDKINFSHIIQVCSSMEHDIVQFPSLTA